jgi:glycine/D-amino acid oxidase-like deaminating enzyme
MGYRVTGDGGAHGRPLWFDAPHDGIARPALDADAAVDVAVVGGGYTGLWTAHALLAADPTLRVLVIERDVVGAGASGRNGGWCDGMVAAGFERLAAAGGRDRALAMTRELHRTVDEVGRVAAAEGIDCHFAKSGTVTLARNGGQLARLRTEVSAAHGHGLSEGDIRMLGADETRAVVDATSVVGGLFWAHCAAVQPYRLVRGLARAVEARGGRIVEGTAVTGIGPRTARTSHGTVRADVVVRAVEGYTPELLDHHRTLAPLSSMMIATEPLSAEQWDRIGLRRRELLNDARHVVIYAQRTADDRLAFGGRGAGYRFGSEVADGPRRPGATHDRIHRTMVELFPSLADVTVTHRWGGVLGVPRDWFPSVGLDRGAGLAWAGGYVGEGVAASNLAGRTLADLILGRATELVTFPWVDHRSRVWEPEPFRWLGINGTLAVMKAADAAEARRDRPSRSASLAWRLLRR